MDRCIVTMPGRRESPARDERAVAIGTSTERDAFRDGSPFVVAEPPEIYRPALEARGTYLDPVMGLRAGPRAGFGRRGAVQLRENRHRDRGYALELIDIRPIVPQSS
jgi:hypothetical protein